jgi:hypothetical protein
MSILTTILLDFDNGKIQDFLLWSLKYQPPSNTSPLYMNS